MDPRGRVPLTRHILSFHVPKLASTLSDNRYPDKNELQLVILQMRSNGMNYRQIGESLGIHWTRISQIVKALKS